MSKILDKAGLAVPINATQNDSNLDSLSGINEQQTGTTYTVTIDDQNRTIEFSNASTVTVTLTLISTITAALHTSDFKVTLKNIGAGDVVVTPTTDTFDDGDATKTLTQYEWITIQTDHGQTKWNVISSAHASSLDGIESTQFLRSDANDTGTGDYTLSGTNTHSGMTNTFSGATVTFNGTTVNANPTTLNMAGTTVAISAGTVTFSGTTVNINPTTTTFNGTTVNITATNWQRDGVSITSSAAELNKLDGTTILEEALGIDRTQATGVTVTSGSTQVVSHSVGTVVAGDIIYVTSRLSGTKGVTGGATYYTLNSTGTSTISADPLGTDTFAMWRETIVASDFFRSTDIVMFEVTVGGTCTLAIDAVSAGSNSTGCSGTIITHVIRPD